MRSTVLNACRYVLSFKPYVVPSVVQRRRLGLVRRAYSEAAVNERS